MASPRVSVLLPVHNGERFIAAAIDSVLRQSFSDFELLVVDDHSTDGTRRRIDGFCDTRIVVVRNSENLGLQKSLNVGLQRARGTYIARIDDDDVWVDDHKLKKQIDFLERRPDCGLIGTGAVVTDERGGELFRFLNPAEDAEIRRTFLARNCFVHSSVVFPKDEALRHGGYSEDPAERHAEDYHLWLAIGCRRKLANLPEYSVRYCQRPSSVSGRNRVAQYKNNLSLVWRYRMHYPNPTLAVVRSVLRLLVYGYLDLSVLRWVTAFTK